MIFSLFCKPLEARQDIGNVSRSVFTDPVTMEIGPPSFHQDVLTNFIGEEHFARHIRRMRILYRGRRNSLVDSINSELGSMVKVLGNEAGLHLTVTLATAVSDSKLAERAAGRNFGFGPYRPLT